MNEAKLLRALNSSAKDLQKRIEEYLSLVNGLSKIGTDCEMLEPLSDFCLRRTREHMLKTTILEAIDILEETRKAFKSKALEALRKKLTQVLIDLN